MGVLAQLVYFAVRNNSVWVMVSADEQPIVFYPHPPIAATMGAKQGTKRERPLSCDNAFLRFRIFRESGYEKDGGRVFTVRVTEEEGDDPETNDLADGACIDVYW